MLVERQLGEDEVRHELVEVWLQLHPGGFGLDAINRTPRSSINQSADIRHKDGYGPLSEELEDVILALAREPLLVGDKELYLVEVDV